VIERAVILSSRGVLRVPSRDLKTRASALSTGALTGPAHEKRARSAVQAPARDEVVQALKETGGRVGGLYGAAARLGLKRTTLIAHMKRLGIDPRTVINPL
jgi:formate hydrogenlyase transcriptional activator